MAILVLTAGQIEIIGLPVDVVWTRFVTIDQPCGGDAKVAWEHGGAEAHAAAKTASDVASYMGISMQEANEMLTRVMSGERGER